MRRPVLILLIVVAVLIFGAIALPFLVDANQFRPEIEAELTRSLGRDVKIGDLKLGLFSGTVAASQLSVADDTSFSRAPFLTAKALTLSIDIPRALFSRKLKVSGIRIDAPSITLIQAPSGLWNFSSLGAKSPAHSQPVQGGATGFTEGNLSLSVQSLKISNARLMVAREGNPAILDKVHIEVTNFAPGSVFPFSLSGQIGERGEVNLAGKAGPIDAANAASTPLTTSLKLKSVKLAASGIVPASSGLDGLISVDGTANSNGRSVEITGTLRAENLKLAPAGTAARNPLVITIDMTDDMTQHSGQLKQGDIAIGGMKGNLTGGWTQQGTETVLAMKFSAPGVPVSGIMNLLPSLGIVLPAGSSLEGGTATAALAISGPASKAIITGPVQVEHTQLKGFDLGSKMSAIETFAGLRSGPNTSIQTLSTSLRMAPDGTSLQNIHVVAPSVGELTGAGTISRSQVLDFRMHATVHASGLISTRASASIPFTIAGTASDPQFRADVGQLAQDQIKQRLKGVRVGGVDAGGLVQGLFGGKKK